MFNTITIAMLETVTLIMVGGGVFLFLGILALAMMHEEGGPRHCGG